MSNCKARIFFLSFFFFFFFVLPNHRRRIPTPLTSKFLIWIFSRGIYKFFWNEKLNDTFRIIWSNLSIFFMFKRKNWEKILFDLREKFISKNHVDAVCKTSKFTFSYLSFILCWDRNHLHSPWEIISRPSWLFCFKIFGH